MSDIRYRIGFGNNADSTIGVQPGQVIPETYYLIDEESNLLVDEEGNNLIYT